MERSHPEILQELVRDPGEVKPLAKEHSDKGGARNARKAERPACSLHLYIGFDEPANAVLVIGRANKVAVAEKILEAIDVRPGSVSQEPCGQPFLKVYRVSQHQAESTAATLQCLFKSATIAAAGSDTVMVYARPREHEAIKALLKSRHAR